ncbi:MAG: carbohydrate porin [Acetobacteraceae bacterium]
MRQAALLVLIACALAPAAALADDPLPVFDPSPATPHAIASPLTGTALDPVVRLGHSLLESGILPRVRYVQSFAANPVGGLTQGTDTSGVVIFGADAELEKLAGLQGARLHATFAQFYGHELATDHIGTRTKVQSFYYPKKQFELAELTYEQSLLDGRVNVVVGRANATGEFARSTYGCRFQNVLDCPFELTQAVGGFPGFPYVNWGGHVRVKPTAETYVKAGAFETNSTRNTNSGFDWGFNHSTGYLLPFELGYGTEYATDPYPRHAKLGGWYNSAPYNDPYLNTKGRSRALFGGKPAAYEGGRSGLYALADQVVYRYDRSTRRGLAVFGSAAGPFDGNGIFAFEGVAGALWTGPIASRPDDQVGLLGSYIRLSNKEDAYLNDLLTKAKSTSRVARNQFIFEINYNYRVLDGIYLASSLQYLVNPDDISRTSAKQAPRDALVVGLKLAVNVNELLGLPPSLPTR